MGRSDNVPPGDRSYLEKSYDMIQYVNKNYKENRYFLIDLSRIVERHELWSEKLPGVTPFYALKCNPNKYVVNVLNILGSSFDCASQAEIETVQGVGGKKEDIIYANPVKGVDHLAFAREQGIDVMTFDSVEELEKIKKHYPQAKLIVRIMVDDSKSLCKFNIKFGASDAQVDTILARAKELAIDIKGVSFHVGSGCRDSDVYKKAVLSANEVIKKGRALGHTMDTIDVGGGFPSVETHVTFAEITDRVKSACQSVVSGVRIIGEPGRFMVGHSHTFVAGVNLEKKEYSENGVEKYRVYINDGVYGSFSGVMYDHQEPVIYALLANTQSKQEFCDNYPSLQKFETTIFGPTCDSIDKMPINYQFPKLQEGDQVVVPNFGDYSIASGTGFHGFKKPREFYYFSNPQHAQKFSHIFKNADVTYLDLHK